MARAVTVWVTRMLMRPARAAPTTAVALSMPTAVPMRAVGVGAGRLSSRAAAAHRRRGSRSILGEAPADHLAGGALDRGIAR
jgi:hypothetical protein